MKTKSIRRYSQIGGMECLGEGNSWKRTTIQLLLPVT